MKKHRITHHHDAIYPNLRTLYDHSFPVYEKRTDAHQLVALEDNRYHLLCFLDDNQLIGFFGYWEFTDYLYIEHYAINTDIRGKGYGTQLLKQLLSETNKTVILEIDPIIDEISQKRLRFYQHLGFVENSDSHKHPAYQSQYEPHSLIVLSSHHTITPEQYQQFVQDLSTIVMKKA